MKTSIIAFVFSALIGVGFHYSAIAAPKQNATPIAKPAVEPPKEEPPKEEPPKEEPPKEEPPKEEPPKEEEAPQPGGGGSAQCTQLLADYQKAEEAADAACERSERSKACRDASKAIEDLEGNLEQKQCNLEGKGNGDDDIGRDDGEEDEGDED